MKRWARPQAMPHMEPAKPNRRVGHQREIRRVSMRGQPVNRGTALSRSETVKRTARQSPPTTIGIGRVA